MFDFAIYVMQLAAVSVLLALALSVYIDGIGYVVFHILGVAGVGSYAYAILTTQFGWQPFPSLVAGSAAGAVAGGLCAEAVRTLRGDGLTLAMFGLGVSAFELFRYLKITGGVFGIAGIPPLESSGLTLLEILWPIVLVIVAGGMVAIWRRSLGGMVVISLRLDEWAAVSLGARLTAHQRITGLFAGFLSGLGGCYFAAMSGFLEPRDFRPTGLLVPLAATILAAGRTPIGVSLTATCIVLLSQAVRFLGGSPIIAGPVTEILVAFSLGVALVIVRIRGERTLELPPAQTCAPAR